MVLVSSLNTKPLDSDLEQMARTDSIIYFFIFPNHSSINSPKQLWKSLISSSGFEEGACNSSALAVLHRGQNLPCLFFFQIWGICEYAHGQRCQCQGSWYQNALSDSLECLWIYLFSRWLISDCKI